MSDDAPIDFDSDEPRCIWITGYEASLRLDELQHVIWERMADATGNRWAAFTDDDLRLLVGDGDGDDYLAMQNEVAAELERRKTGAT